MTIIQTTSNLFLENDIIVESGTVFNKILKISDKRLKHLPSNDEKLDVVKYIKVFTVMETDTFNGTRLKKEKVFNNESYMVFRKEHTFEQLTVDSIRIL